MQYLQVGLWSGCKPIGIVAGEIVGHAVLTDSDLLGRCCPVSMLAEKKRESLHEKGIVLGGLIYSCHHVAQHRGLTASQQGIVRHRDGEQQLSNICS